MGETILSLLKSVDAYYFPMVGLFYVIMKIVVKYFIRVGLSLQYDFWEISSWFGVDLSVLNLSASIAIKIDEILKRKHKIISGGVWWYIFLVVAIIISAIIYGYINKRRARGDLNFWCHSRLGLLLSSSWLIGFAVLLAMIEIVNK